MMAPCISHRVFLGVTSLMSSQNITSREYPRSFGLLLPHCDWDQLYLPFINDMNAPAILSSLFAMDIRCFVFALLHLLTIAYATTGTILAPANGTNIAPGASFSFQYSSRADYGISSYNYTVWLLTSLPTTFMPTDTFATGYFFGRFSAPNYPGNPYPKNPAPSQLIMPDFSNNPGGTGGGASAINAHYYITVLEEYATGQATAGFRIGLAVNQITYNATSHT